MLRVSTWSARTDDHLITDVYRGGSGASSYNDQARRGGGFDEYDAGDDEEDQGSSGRRSAGANRNGAGAGGVGGTRSTRGATASSSSKSSAATPVEAKKAPIVDLFSFGDDEDTIPPAAAAATAGSSSLVDGEFGVWCNSVWQNFSS